MTKEAAKPALIFDLDGTLIDSFSQIAEACNATRSKNGFTEVQFSSLKRLVGLPADLLFADLELPKRTVEKLVREFRMELGKLVAESNLDYPSAFHFIQLAKNEGCQLGVATSKPEDLAIQVIENSIFDGIFNHIAGTGVAQAKPQPDVINACLKEFDTDFAFMFGDRPEDIHAASNAGISAIGLAQGVYTAQELSDFGAVISFPDFEAMFESISSHKGGFSDYFGKLCR
jgi:phosphoglycolate phosphatase